MMVTNVILCGRCMSFILAMTERPGDQRSYKRLKRLDRLGNCWASAFPPWPLESSKSEKPFTAEFELGHSFRRFSAFTC